MYTIILTPWSCTNAFNIHWTYICHGKLIYKVCIESQNILVGLNAAKAKMPHHFELGSYHYYEGKKMTFIGLWFIHLKWVSLY